MTLGELSNMFFTRPTGKAPNEMYIFRDEKSADNWIENLRTNGDCHDYELLAVYKSDLKMKYVFSEELCNAEVNYFYAVKPDVLAVVVEPKDWWNSPYQKGSKERDYDAEYRNHSEMILNAQKVRDKDAT